MRLRILILVTHLLGAGHLTRAAALACAAARAGHQVTLVTGGMPNPLVETGGVALVQLPPVRAPLGDFTALRDADGRAAGPGLLAARREALLAAHAESRPDVVVTELFPFGRRVLAAEFQALIEAADASPCRPVVLASVRDILVAPDRPAKVAATHATIRRHYDAVLVHGEPGLVPLEASWPVDEELRPKLRYTGYVGPGTAGPAPPAAAEPVVLVSGGSSAAALPLYRAALAAAARSPALRWHVLVGAGVDEDAFRDLRARAGPNGVVERARADFRDLMIKSAVFVGQAGYNTVMDIVATQARAVLVPFEQGRETEQRLRAAALSERSLATLVTEARLEPRALHDAVATELGRKRAAAPFVRQDGAAETVRIVEEIRARRAGGAAA